MAFKIGFSAEHPEEQPLKTEAAVVEEATPRRSLVQVYFAKRDTTLSYYNDRFDLHRGDVVYVDGKLAGLRGRVVAVNYTFRIKASEYQRVIAVADTSVHGQFFLTGSHFVTFDRTALPYDKAASWFMPPAGEEDEIISGSDDSAFCLEDLHGMDVSSDTAQRGHEYYREDRVRYLCLDGANGRALVEGQKTYEVRFCYRGGKISDLTCSCFCGGQCRHAFAAMLQLRETLRRIRRHYLDEYESTGYFAALDKSALFHFAIGSKDTGSFTL